MTDTLDLAPVTAPTGRPPRRIVRRAVATLLILAAVVSAGVWLNHRAFSHLLDSIEASEQVLVDYNESVSRISRSAPAFLTDDARAGLRRSLTSASDDALVNVLIDQRRVRDLRIWPWDRDTLQARERYLDHLEAWEKKMRDVSKGVYDTGSPEIEATFELTNDALTDAVPLIEGDYEERVAAIAEG